MCSVTAHAHQGGVECSIMHGTVVEGMTRSCLSLATCPVPGCRSRGLRIRVELVRAGSHEWESIAPTALARQTRLSGHRLLVQ